MARRGKMSELVDKAASNIKDFLALAEAEIEAKIDSGVPIATTKLAEKFATQFGMDAQQGYHLLRIYLNLRPELCIKRGRDGGLIRK